MEVSKKFCFLQAVTKKGGRYLEAPVSGTKQPAEQGKLIFLSGGDEVSSCRPFEGSDPVDIAVHRTKLEISVHSIKLNISVHSRKDGKSSSARGCFIEAFDAVAIRLINAGHQGKQ
jgi:hypothetical protein